MTHTSVKNFFDNFTEEERIQILKDYKELLETGIQGDTLLRRKTQEISKFLGTSFGAAFNMNVVATEICTRIAFEKYNIQ